MSGTTWRTERTNIQGGTPHLLTLLKCVASLRAVVVLKSTKKERPEPERREYIYPDRGVVAVDCQTGHRG